MTLILPFSKIVKEIQIITNNIIVNAVSDNPISSLHVDTWVHCLVGSQPG